MSTPSDPNTPAYAAGLPAPAFGTPQTAAHPTAVPPAVWAAEPAPEPRPTANPHGVQVASMGRRIGAYLIDALVLGALTLAVEFVVLIVVAVASGGSYSFHLEANADATSSELLELAGIFAVLCLVPLLYWSVLPGRPGIWLGRSVGKRTLDLQLITIEGTAITPGIARRRGVAFVGPLLVAVIAGPLLDAATGRPPLFTVVLFALGYVYVLVDNGIAPLFGDHRRTLHDRFAGTVAVDVRTAPVYLGCVDVHGQPLPGEWAPPAVTPPIGRAKSAATVVYAAVGIGVVALLIAVLAIASGGSTTATAQVASSDVSVTAGDPQSRVFDVAVTLGEQLGSCFGNASRDLSQCDSARALGLPRGNFKVVDGTPPAGNADSVGRIVLGDAGEWGETGRVIGTYDAAGAFWGYIVNSDAQAEAICRNGADSICDDRTASPGGHAFLNSRARVLQVVDAMRTALGR